jgi:hypothetical protein
MDAGKSIGHSPALKRTLAEVFKNLRKFRGIYAGRKIPLFIKVGQRR